MKLCPTCYTQGYCRKLKYALVSDEELENPDFIFDGRMAAFDLGIKPDQWHEQITNWYRDFQGRFMDNKDSEIPLDTSQLELKNIRTWFRDFAYRKPDPNIPPVLYATTKERARVFLSILRVQVGVNAELWGVRAANDR